MLDSSKKTLTRDRFCLKIAGRRISTIVCDLDGTLLHEDASGNKSISDQAFAQIRYLMDRGIFFVVASGRQLYNVRNLFGDLQDRMGIVAENGALAVAPGGKTVREDVLEEKTARDLIGELRLEPDSELMVACREENYSVPHDMEFVRHLVERVGYRTGVLEDYSQITDPILKVSIHFPAGIPEDRNRYYHEKYGDRALVNAGGPKWLDFMPYGSGKGSALQALAEHEGLPMEEILVFGDSENDISMFERAGLSIAMRSGLDSAKEAADALADSVEEVLEKCVQQAAMSVLEEYVAEISLRAGRTPEQGETLWKRILTSPGVMRELSYFHDTGDFWGGYKVCGITLPDVVVWQVDHFKAYMDREDRNRFHRERLFLEALESMLDLEKDPGPVLRKMKEESGTDREDV